MSEVFRNRRGELIELNFPHSLSPNEGVCAKCGASLGAYWSKVIDRNTGDVYCQDRCGDWAKAMFLIEHGMHDYSDG